MSDFGSELPFKPEAVQRTRQFKRIGGKSATARITRRRDHHDVPGAAKEGDANYMKWNVIPVDDRREKKITQQAIDEGIQMASDPRLNSENSSTGSVTGHVSVDKPIRGTFQDQSPLSANGSTTLSPDSSFPDTQQIAAAERKQRFFGQNRFGK